MIKTKRENDRLIEKREREEKMERASKIMADTIVLSTRLKRDITGTENEIKTN